MGEIADPEALGGAHRTAGARSAYPAGQGLCRRGGQADAAFGAGGGRTGAPSVSTAPGAMRRAPRVWWSSPNTTTSTKPRSAPCWGERLRHACRLPRKPRAGGNRNPLRSGSGPGRSGGAFVFRQRPWRLCGGLAPGGRGPCPRCGWQNLVALKHPLSVDTYVEKRCRGQGHPGPADRGRGYWPYGMASLQDLARRRGIALAVLPADGRPDPRLDALSTLPVSTCGGWPRCAMRAARSRRRRRWRNWPCGGALCRARGGGQTRAADGAGTTPRAA
jgi:hypothetical protein